MTKRPSILAIVTARGGSKRLPGKNLKALGGKSLLAWTIEAAQRAETIDRTIVSSEDPDIIAAALACGADVPFIRPQELATDTATSVDVVGHALDSVGEFFDILVLLQPTSPLRQSKDIDEAVRLCLDKGASTCVSVTPTAKPLHWIYRTSADARVMPVVAQENNSAEGEAVMLNGAIYVAQTDWFRLHQAFVSPETIGYLMPRDRSVDIDDKLDLILAEALLAASRETIANPAPVRQARVA